MNYVLLVRHQCRIVCYNNGKRSISRLTDENKFDNWDPKRPKTLLLLDSSIKSCNQVQTSSLKSVVFAHLGKLYRNIAISHENIISLLSCFHFDQITKIMPSYISLLFDARLLWSHKLYKHYILIQHARHIWPPVLSILFNIILDKR